MQKKFMIQTRRGRYNVLIWYDENDKAYLVKVPSLPGVVTFGTSMLDARRMAKDAIELCCDCILDEGKVLVDDTGKIVGKLPKTSHILIPAPSS